MKDLRECHSKVLGYFLIISNLLLFIFNYMEVSTYFKKLGSESLIWKTLSEIIPVHIVSISLGVISLSLCNGLANARPKASFFWLVLCLFLLGDSIYILSVQFHIFVLLKSLFFAYITGYALLIYRQKTDESLDDKLPNR